MIVARGFSFSTIRESHAVFIAGRVNLAFEASDEVSDDHGRLSGMFLATSSITACDEGSRADTSHDRVRQYYRAWDFPMARAMARVLPFICLVRLGAPLGLIVAGVDEIRGSGCGMISFERQGNPLVLCLELAIWA
jgi:hypothetical protein